MFTIALRSKKQTPQDIHDLIINQFKIGKTIRQISYLVNVPRSTVMDIIRRYKLTLLSTPNMHQGCPRKTTIQDKRQLMRIVKCNNFDTLDNLAVKWSQSIGKCVSCWTVIRHLAEKGYKSYKAKVISQLQNWFCSKLTFMYLTG